MAQAKKAIQLSNQLTLIINVLDCMEGAHKASGGCDVVSLDLSLNNTLVSQFSYYFRSE